MTIPTRSFDGVPGQRSAGTGGPNQLETDLDNLFNHLDPALHGIQTENIKDLNVTEAKIAANAVTEGKIGTGAVTEDKIGAGAVTDTVVGERTINQAITDDYANTGVLTKLFSWIAKAIKGILGTGATNWYDTPPTTLTTAHNHITAASSAHVSSAIAFTPTTEVVSTNVQSAIAELGTDILGGLTTERVYVGDSSPEPSHTLYKLWVVTDTTPNTIRYWDSVAEAWRIMDGDPTPVANWFPNGEMANPGAFGEYADDPIDAARNIKGMAFQVSSTYSLDDTSYVHYTTRSAGNDSPDDSPVMYVFSAVGAPPTQGDDDYLGIAAVASARSEVLSHRSDNIKVRFSVWAKADIPTIVGVLCQYFGWCTTHSAMESTDLITDTIALTTTLTEYVFTVDVPSTVCTEVIGRVIIRIEFDWGIDGAPYYGETTAHQIDTDQKLYFTNFRLYEGNVELPIAPMTETQAMLENIPWDDNNYLGGVLSKNVYGTIEWITPSTQYSGIISDADGWTLSSTMQSLMTTTGDTLYASAARTPARLAIGTAGQSLLSNGTTPVWSNLFTTAAKTYYVNASTGNDSTGDGSAGAPFATIQHAIDLIPQIVNHTVTINVAAGTYNESPSIQGFVGRGTIILNGNTTTTIADSEDYKIKQLLVKACACFVYVCGFNSIASVSNFNFLIDKCISVDMRYCMAVASESSAYAFGTYYSHVQLIGCYVSNHSAAVWASSCSTVVSANWTAGTGNTIGLRAEYAATIGKINTQPQGTTAESVQYGGEIR